MKSIKEFERRAAESILARDAAGRARNDARQALDELDGVSARDRTAAFYAVPEHAVPGRGYGHGGRFADDGDHIGGPAAAPRQHRTARHCSSTTAAAVPITRARSGGTRSRSAWRPPRWC